MKDTFWAVYDENDKMYVKDDGEETCGNCLPYLLETREEARALLRLDREWCSKTSLGEGGTSSKIVKVKLRHIKTKG